MKIFFNSEGGIFMRRIFSYLYYAGCIAFVLCLGLLENGMQEAFSTFSFSSMVPFFGLLFLLGAFVWLKRFVHLSPLEILLCDVVCVLAFLILSPLLPFLGVSILPLSIYTSDLIMFFSFAFLGYFLADTVSAVVTLVKQPKA